MDGMASVLVMELHLVSPMCACYGGKSSEPEKDVVHLGARQWYNKAMIL